MKEPRQLLQEFGTHELELAALVTRDSMIGVVELTGAALAAGAAS